ncbi:hypothetical protein B0H21DRAFT_695393 [Amylocystis lapponica]|nr:hypothetical protein B0H21DRAFT_695393 [Amylocystis lapponica]
MLANSLRAQTRAILAASSRVSSASRFTRASPICTSFSRLLSTSHVLRAAGFAQHSERRRQGDEDEYGGSEGTGVFSRRRGGGDNVRSRPEPSDEDATTTLYVGNLAFWASEDDVRKLFEPFGDLQDVRLKMTPDGQNRGFAHVEFATPEITRAVMRAHAEEALDFSGRMLKLDYAQTSNFASRMTTRTEDPATQTPRSTLYVGNLPYSVDAEELRQLFSSIAEVQDIRVVYNAEGVSRGFAHVDFASIEDAQRVLERQKEQDFSLQQRMLFVSYARRSQAEDGDKSSRRRNPPSETLWVGGLPEGTREEDLRDIFEPLGEIRAVRLSTFAVTHSLASR